MLEEFTSNCSVCGSDQTKCSRRRLGAEGKQCCIICSAMDTHNERRQVPCEPSLRGTCIVHGGRYRSKWGSCIAVDVLFDVLRERARQFATYGTNESLKDGTGPKTRWLGPFTGGSADHIENRLRADYEDFEAEAPVTWVHLVREEVAEAFKEDDPARLREELIQVAALCVSWVEKLDERPQP